jgi:DNA helicase-2/ATP-dependent DNA helicase PcrA
MELLSVISEYLKQSDNEGLEGFIEKVSLLNDIDNWSSKQEVVTLMTLHNAKGLEFSTVFIPGLEEGLFPLYTRMNNISEIEEERRIFYVGATRALDKLFLSYALKRMRLGEIKKSDCSRFLNEVDKNYIEGEI